MAMAMLATSANAQVFNKEVKEFAKVEMRDKLKNVVTAQAGPKRLKENQELLGYTNSNGNKGVMIDGFPDWESVLGVASCIPNNNNVFESYKGYKIVGLRYAVYGSLGNAKAYSMIYKNKEDKEGLLISTILSDYKVCEEKGDNLLMNWNEDIFDDSYTITGEEPLLLYGFMYTQVKDEKDKNAYPLLLGKEKVGDDNKYSYWVFGKPTNDKELDFYSVPFKEGYYVPCFQLIVESPNGETGILGVDGTLQPVPSKYYTLDGKQLSAPQKGLNLVKMSDGTTRKVVK